MNVVVGKSLDHQTPIFVEQMEYVIFRPYWNPPYGITVKEIVPHARRDPVYLDRGGPGDRRQRRRQRARRCRRRRRISPRWSRASCTIRQQPGPNNSLGLAKFIFPNDENVYMHGTPAQQLFSRVRRDFSHGCIRLEDPARFAEWVLRDQPEWTAREDRRGDEGRTPDARQPQAAAHGRAVLRHGARELGRRACSSWTTSTATIARSTPRSSSGYPYPTKG